LSAMPGHAGYYSARTKGAADINIIARFHIHLTTVADLNFFICEALKDKGVGAGGRFQKMHVISSWMAA